jgi:hypothetical protein
MQRARSMLLVVMVACGGVDDEGEVPASAQPVTAAFSETTVLALAFGAPLGEAGRDLGPGTDQGTVRGEAEQAFGGGPDTPAAGDGLQGGDEPVVEGTTCVTWTWGVGLSATIVFDMCTLQSGDTVDGTLTIAITLTPVTIALGFDALTINQDTLDGTLAVSSTGGDGDRVTTLTTDFTYTTGGGATTLALSGVTVTNTETGTVIDGSGALTTESVDVTFTATAVTWKDGECHPSSGTLRYDDGTVDATIGFLPTTPADGIVTVTVGSFTTQAMLLAPCT